MIAEQVKEALLPVGNHEAFVELTVATGVKLNKKDKDGNPNPYSEIIKVSDVVVIVNRDYQEAVNDQRKVEGNTEEFVQQERKWGVRNGCFLENNGVEYLCAIEHSKGESKFYLDGEEIEELFFEPFYPKKSASKSQGVENEVKFRTYKLSNINSLKILSVKVI